MTLRTPAPSAPRTPGREYGGHSAYGHVEKAHCYGEPGEACACGTVLRSTNQYNACDCCLRRGRKASKRPRRSSGSPASAGSEAATSAAPAARVTKEEKVAKEDGGHALRLVKLRAWCADGTAKRLRLAAGLSLGDISREIGTDKATIMHWEKGERRPQAAEYVGRYMSLLDRVAAELDSGSEVASQLISEPGKCAMGNSHTPAPATPPAPAPVIPPPEQPANVAAPTPEPSPGPPSFAGDEDTGYVAPSSEAIAESMLRPFAGIIPGTLVSSTGMSRELHILTDLEDLEDAARERVLQYAVDRWWLK